MIAPRAMVLRGGVRHAVDAREIVPGDVVVLEAGDKAPADLRLLRARGVLADEAILTGESVPAEKHEEPVAADAPLGDRFSMVYSGTVIATGQATGVVVATGANSEIGRISTMIGQVETLTTPLLRQINHFGRLFTWFAVLMAASVFAFAMLARDYPWVDALMSWWRSPSESFRKGCPPSSPSRSPSAFSGWPPATPWCAACRPSRRSGRRR